MEDYEIDDFEKLYVLAVADLSSSVEISDRTFDEKRFDEICNLAKFKKEHPEMFDDENKVIIDDDMNYYVIPRMIKQKVRSGNKEITIEKEAYILMDSSGNNVGLILEDGMLLKDSGAKKEIVEKAIKVEEKEEKEIEQKNRKEQEDIEPEVKEQEEQEQEEISSVNGAVRNNNKNRVYKEAIELGIDPKIIDEIAKHRNCRVDQINIRKIENMEKISEDTGLNLKLYRGKIIAIRINYGSERRCYLVNSETGKFFNPHQLENVREDIPEVEDYFKYRFRPGVEESRPLRTDEGRSYITYLGVNGEQKSMKYINNGKEEDMVKDERERYLAEIEEANKVLQDVIDEYQQVNSHDNWLKVKDAMKARVYIDKKYDVLDNQKKVTKDTLEETVDETLVKYGPDKEDIREEVEDDPRLNRDPRWR